MVTNPGVATPKASIIKTSATTTSTATSQNAKPTLQMKNVAA